MSERPSSPPLPRGLTIYRNEIVGPYPSSPESRATTRLRTPPEEVCTPPEEVWTLVSTSASRPHPNPSITRPQIPGPRPEVTLPTKRNLETNLKIHVATAQPIPLTHAPPPRTPQSSPKRRRQQLETPRKHLARACTNVARQLSSPEGSRPPRASTPQSFFRNTSLKNRFIAAHDSLSAFS